MITLKENERLVQAGTVALRTPNGDMRPSIPQYIIVPEGEAVTATVAEVGENERLVCGGQIFNKKKLAEERYATIMAGRKPAPREKGAPLYFIEDTDGINPKTGLTRRDETEIDLIAIKYAEIFAIQQSKDKSLEGIK